MYGKNNRIVYWDFLVYDGIQKLNKNQRVIGSHILKMPEEKLDDQYNVIILIEEIVEEEKQ